MKKLVFLLSFCCFVLLANAQDVLVKKDGSTIVAKVEKVTSSEVDYKKFSNLNGPTYTISISDLVSINYENGEKDVFETVSEIQQSVATQPETNVSNYNPNIMTNETASQFSNDQRLLSMYYADNQEISSLKSKAKKWKIAGIAGGCLFVGGVYMIICSHGRESDAFTNLQSAGYVLAGVGLAGGVTSYIIGNNYSKKAKQIEKSIASFPILEKGIDLADGNSINFGVDMMNFQMPESHNFNPGIGVGIRYNF